MPKPLYEAATERKDSAPPRADSLFIKQLIATFDAWIELDSLTKLRVSDSEVAQQIYSLLGHIRLRPGILRYLEEPLLSGGTLQKCKRLFQRLHYFYMNWCDGRYIEKAPSENWPQHKVMQMKASGVQIGLVKVDICAGLNVMILLFKLHSYSNKEEFQNEKFQFKFNPCGDSNTENFDCNKLLRIIGYSQASSINEFRNTVGCHLIDADLSEANLCGVDLSGANLSRANLSGASLSRADLSKANLSKADLSKVDLSQANVRRTNLSRANLSGANLTNSALSGSTLSGANLSDTNFYCAFLYRVYLREANLSKADLRHAEMRCCDLSKSNLSKADLRHADMSYCDLSMSNLSKADLRHADMSYAKIRSANLEDILVNEETNWTDIRCWKSAKNLPQSLRTKFWES